MQNPNLQFGFCYGHFVYFLIICSIFLLFYLDVTTESSLIFTVARVARPLQHSCHRFLAEEQSIKSR